MGTANELITDGLSAGLHKISLTVSDHTSQTDETSIFVTIDGSRPLERPSQQEKDAVAAIFNGIIPQKPLEAPAARSSSLLLIALGGLTVVIVGCSYSSCCGGRVAVDYSSMQARVWAIGPDPFVLSSRYCDQHRRDSSLRLFSWRNLPLPVGLRQEAGLGQAALLVSLERRADGSPD